MAAVSSSDSPRTLSQSPPISHTPPHSLAAAAALNAGIQTEESRRSSGGTSMRRDVEHARRRSSIRMNLNLNDPSIPAPGEMQISPSLRTRGAWPHSPHHERAPSLGELHQELEYEQEGQVNRLLHMIRQQQAQISALQASQQPQSQSSAIDDSTPTSERSVSLPHASTQPAPVQQLQQQQPTPRSRSPFNRGGTPLSRTSSIADRSRTNSRAGSPALRPIPIPPSSIHDSSTEWLQGTGMSAQRDESAFYQAETQNLIRENQMLKLRIRELERQLSELNPTSSITHSPVRRSSLHGGSPSTISRRPVRVEEPVGEGPS
ncbi:uncharacterized protein EI97DRAFT_455652 [Westerdykella ornata]|uniref:Uncharacterized protein n=1 Tax=Westerdykella ornata TaxID=318751 RepID=A0A6A6JS03_WESOR|nr:uncharacterized protein EI97DRAFT_455652 [Westerdykella ornata]KAF2279401.1 hypothetical protein EI97DRAFT_455652 [Westerdykella ornata]